MLCDKVSPGLIDPYPTAAAVHAAIDAAACSYEDARRLPAVHQDCEDVGIVAHSGGKRGPVRTTIEASPGKMRRARVDDTAIGRVECDGDNRSYPELVFRRNPPPCIA